MDITNQPVLSKKPTPVIFQGKTSEYFGIWIVNLLLSLITLGIYSAWAKVRRKKYFYNNTLIDNVGFDYHAKPISILKGRLIAVAFFIAYGMSASIHPFLPAVFLGIFFIVLPWLVVRGSIFSARNTSHRGLRFDFIGTIGQAAKVFIGLPLLFIPTLGLIFPYVAHQKSQFLVNNHRFGLSQFDMQPVVKKYYKVYFIVMILPVFIAIIGIIAAIAIPAYHGYVNKAKVAPQAQLAMPAGVAAFAAVNPAPKMILAANETPADQTEDLPPVSPEEEKIIQEEMEAQAEISKEMQAERIAADEATQEKTPEKIMQKNQRAQDEKNFEKTTKEPQQATEKIASEPRLSFKDWLIILVGSYRYLLLMYGVISLIYALTVFGFVGYIQARIGNLIWNNTTLDKLSFSSNLRARDFIWLYFSNIVAIMLTFGLATPWAQIRMARYRASKLQIVGDVDFDQFVGDKKAEVKATGEEIAEMFDVDLSFG